MASCRARRDRVNKRDNGQGCDPGGFALARPQTCLRGSEEVESVPVGESDSQPNALRACSDERDRPTLPYNRL